MDESQPLFGDDVHPKEDLLLDYIGKLLPEAEAQHVQHHIAKCDICAKSVDSLVALIGGLERLLPDQQTWQADQVRKVLREVVDRQTIWYMTLHVTDFPPIYVACSNKGWVRLSFSASGQAAFAEQLVTDFSGYRLCWSADKFADGVQQLHAYFAGTPTTFTMPVDLSSIKRSFHLQVLQALQHIPYGTVKTYGELATDIHSPDASRAVGVALGRNPLPIVLPCHRIVASRGKLGGFTGGVILKKKLLRLERVQHPSLIQQENLFDP